MLIDAPFSLILNSFTLALAISFLIIVLWYDVRRRVNFAFALLMVLVSCWNAGFLLTSLINVVSDSQILLDIAFLLTNLGFTGSAIVLYALITALTEVQPRYFRFMVAFYFSLAVIYTVIALQRNIISDVENRAFLLLFYIVFDFLTLYVAWRYRRKLRNNMLLIGVALFVAGQGSVFLNPSLGINILSTTISTAGTVILSFAIVQQEIITPLVNRGNQMVAMHEVSLAITSRFATDAVLNEIAEQAARWMNADAAGIFLKRNQHLQLVTAYQLPEAVIGTQLLPGEGVAGQVVQQSKTIYLENYQRDWKGKQDLPLAKDTFGSLIGVPLTYDDEVIGALLVIAGTQGVLFDQNDVDSLELLASQAAVAISHGELFAEQKNLTEQLETAHEQLKTVLVSTESPVVAVDRQLRLIFANPAAESLLGLDDTYNNRYVVDVIPERVLPDNYRQVLRDIYQNRAHIYEVSLNDKTYLCHLASLGDARIEGWVAVFNDITELKELDRIKSEMVRMTSHDLKNPLQAAMANLELLRDDIRYLDSSDVEEIKLSADNIERQLNKMHRIIRGILDIERVRLTTQSMQPCYPAAIIHRALDEMSEMIADNNIQVDVDIAPDIHPFAGDEGQFERALINLIENAIKFNHSGGEIQIQARNEKQSVKIKVSDSGIGIPSDMQSKIFDRFYRAEQRGAEHITGTGLGLSLVKTVVENHQGIIDVHSTAGHGTTFTIVLPALSERATISP
jgi:signal transduction histidine kinase